MEVFEVSNFFLMIVEESCFGWVDGQEKKNDDGVSYSKVFFDIVLRLVMVFKDIEYKN